MSLSLARSVAAGRTRRRSVRFVQLVQELRDRAHDRGDHHDGHDQQHEPLHGKHSLWVQERPAESLPDIDAMLFRIVVSD